MPYTLNNRWLEDMFIPNLMPQLLHLQEGKENRHPNLTFEEIFALIQAKKVEYFEKLHVAYVRDLMDPKAIQWQCNSNAIMAFRYVVCSRNHHACKMKWNLLIPNYKRLANYHAQIHTNLMFWNLSTTKHQQKQ